MAIVKRHGRKHGTTCDKGAYCFWKPLESGSACVPSPSVMMTQAADKGPEQLEQNGLANWILAMIRLLRVGRARPQ
jgi:hypothetical protein